VKRFLFILVLIGSVSVIKAQFMDTLREVIKRKYSLDARLESRYSLYENSLINVTGVRIGVAFQHKLRIGAGLSWLKTDATKIFNEKSEDGSNVRTLKRLKFWYLCYYLDFVFYKTKRWQLSVPIQLGTGSCWYQKERGYNLGGNDSKYFLLLYEPGITAQFKIFKWFGLGSDVGYRFSLSSGKKSGINLNSPSYSFKVLFWFDQLYYDLFPKSELTKRFGPSYW
jgi:hypothetical protein